MSGPLSVALTADIGPYERAMGKAKDVAVRHSTDIAQAFVGAAGKIDKSFLGLSNAPGMTALARLPAMAKAAVAGFIAFEAVKFALNETDKAAKAAQERLESLVKIGTQAQGAGVGTTFLQSWTQQARDLHVEVRTLEGMLEHARQASTLKIGEGENGATSAMIDRLKQNVMAGNLEGGALEKFIGAKDQEARIRVVLDLLEQLKAKGMQLAAFDLGGKFFGGDFENQLRNGVDMIGRMRQALDGLQVAGGDRIIPAEEIARAQAINEQLDRSRDIFANALRPLQEDMAAWQQQQLAAYADFVTMTASWAAALGGVYEKLRSVGDLITSIGNSSVFASINKWAESAGIAGNNWGGTSLQLGDPNPKVINVKPSGIAPAGDKSHALPSLRTPKATGGGGSTEADVDSVERLIRSMEKSNAQLQVEIDTMGKSTKVREEGLAIVRAEAAAREDVARGKRADATLDEDERMRILATADAYATLKDKQKAAHEAQAAWKDIGATLSDSFKEAVLEGRNLGDVLNSLVKKLEGKAIDKIFDLVFSGATGGAGGAGIFAGIGKAFGFAEGGEINGPGTGTSDSILARVSTGEFIVNAKSTSANRALLQAINSGRVPTFANGGMVGAPSIPSAGFGAQAAGGSQTITLAPNVTLNASGGTPEHNADLARQTSKAVEETLRGIVAREFREHMRPGGMFNH
jgi:hypothetical protein